VVEKALEWFPDPLPYRGRIYPALKQWAKESVLELLWPGLFNDPDENKHAAATTIAELFAGDATVEDRLYALCHTVADAETLCAAIEALMQGWWDFDRQKQLINAARQSVHPHLRLVGIRGRIKAALHDGDDLDEVLALAAEHEAYPTLLQTLCVGWRNNPKAVAACLASARQHGAETGINRGLAKRYLLHFSQSDLELDTKVGALIRNDQFFFSSSFGPSYAPGSYGPEVRAALASPRPYEQPLPQ
jgi:hypothetical protein